MRQQLGDKLQQPVQDFPCDRSTPLAEGRLSFGKRKSFRFRAASRSPLDQRLRYTTEAEMAIDRLLSAYLSRLQAGHWLAELVKDFRGPAITPGLNDAATLPVERVRQEKTGRIPHVSWLMDDHQMLPPLAFQADDFRKRPHLLRVSIPTADAHGPKTVRMVPS